MNIYSLMLMWAIILPFLVSCSSSTNSSHLRLQGSTMGTTWHVIVVEPPKALMQEQLRAIIETRLEDINQKMSTWREDSELSRFNQYQKTDFYPVSKALFTVIQTAQKISVMSEGLFDMSVSPLVELWGFDKHYSLMESPPSEQQIQQILAQVGYGKVILQASPFALKKQNPAITLDVSAIAKGYAVDELALLLENNGISHYLVEIGGEIRVAGHNPRAEKWRIGIETPRDLATSHEVQKGLYVKDTAIATSGDYRNFFEYDGQRYAHVLNPKTGSPIEHQLASVTVLHESTMWADALATTLLVMGDDAGLAFAEQHHLAAYFIVRENEGFRGIASTVFEAI